jgi:hypothetical protein
MDAGLVLGADAVSFDPASITPAPLTYASITLNPSTDTTAAGPSRYSMPLAALQAQARTGAAARALVRAVGRARFADPAAAGRRAATLADPPWRIVQVADGSAAPIDPGITTWSEQRAALAVLNRGGAHWQMVPVHELEP